MRGHPWRFLALGYLVVAVAAAVVYRSTVGAQADAVVAISVVLETPGLTWTVERVTDEPRVEDVAVAGMPTTLVRPEGAGPWPAVVFLNGATELGREHPDVQAFARGLGRAGYVVLVPDLPGLREGEITTRTLDAAIAVSEAAATRRDARNGRIAVVGVSTGAALALLVAAHQPLVRRVSVVGALAPYADLRNVLRLATTSHYRDNGRLVRYETDPFLALAAARSLVAALPAGPVRSAVLADLRETPDDSPDPLRDFEDSHYDYDESGIEAVMRVLGNREPSLFDTLYADLPTSIRTANARLSPIAVAHRVRAPVEIASAPQDKYFPLA